MLRAREKIEGRSQFHRKYEIHMCSSFHIYRFCFIKMYRANAVNLDLMHLRTRFAHEIFVRVRVCIGN